LSAWVNNLIRSTNRVYRVRSSGGRQLPVTALAQAASDLCTTYWELLLDPEFSQFIQQHVLSPSPPTPLVSSEQREELRRNIREAILLLVEAGVDGELAVAALRSVEEVGPFVFSTITNPRVFFSRLREAKDLTCELSDRLRSEAASEATYTRRRRLGFAGVGLVLVGLTGAGLAVLAAPAVAAGVVALGAGGAILTAIGTTVFDQNVGIAAET
jgi:hypothetical protein